LAGLGKFLRPTIAKASSTPPKIKAVHIRPLSNGVHVTHKMAAGGDKQFVFQNPAKMVQHLKRIQNTAWLRPMQDQAPRMAQVLDIGQRP
jgi:hypothetical protein